MDSVESVAREQELLITGAKDMLANIAELEEVRSQPSSECNTLLVGLLEKNPQYSNLLTLQSDGRVLCSAKSLPADFSGFLPIEDEDFQRVERMQTLTVSQHRLSPVTSNHVVYYIYPLQIKPEGFGYIVATLNLEWLNQKLARNNYEHANEIYVIDRQGHVLSHLPEWNGWIGQSIQGSDLQKNLSDQNHQTFESSNSSGEAVMYAVQLVTDPAGGSLYVAGSIPLTLIKQQIQSNIRQSILVFFGILFLTVALDYFTARWLIIQPMQRVITTIRRLADGNLSARTGLKSNNEFGQVAAALDRMAAVLEGHEAELKTIQQSLEESEAHFHRLVEDAPDVIFRYDLCPSFAITYISPVITRITGYSPADFEQQPGLIFHVIHPDDLLKLKRMFSEGRFAEQRVELRWIGMDNHLLWSEALIVPIFDENGRRVAIEGVVRNINERKAMEERLRQQSEELRTIFDHVPGLIFYLDKESRILDTNRMAEKVLCLARENLIGFSIFDLFPEPTAQKFHQCNQEVIRTGKPMFGVEEEVTLPNGEKIYGRTDRIPLSDSDGQVSNILIFAIDMTAVKNAERALEAHRRLLQQIIETSPTGIVRVEKNLDISLLNRAAEKIIGISRKDVNQSFKNLEAWEICDPGSRPLKVEELIYRQVMTSGQPVNDVYYNLTCPDGQRRTISLNAAAVLDENGQPDSFVATFEDITQRSIEAEALRRSEERYRGVYQNSPVAFIVWDHTMQVIEWNQRAEQMFGWSAPEAIGRSLLVLITPPEERDFVISLNRRMFAGDISENTAVSSGRTKDGRNLTIEWHDCPLHDANGKVTGVLSQALDITEREKAAQELRKRMDENRALLTHSRQRNEELEAMAAVTTAMRHTSSRSELLDLLVQKTVEVSGAQSGFITLLQHEKQVIHAAYGPTFPVGETFTPDSSLLWQIFRIKQMVSNSADNQNENIKPEDPLWTFAQSGAFVILPLLAGEIPVGAMMLHFSGFGGLSPQKKRLLHSIADMASNALYRIQVMQDLERLVKHRNRELEALYETTSAASGSLDLNASLNTALNRILQTLNVRSGAIFLLNENEQRIELIVQENLPAEVVKRVQVQQLENSIEGEVILRNEPLIINDLAADLRAGWSIYPQEWVTFTSVPMRVKGKAVGAISITSPGGSPLNIEELSLLSSIADHLGLRCENMRLHQQSEQAAVLAERSRLARDLHDSVTQSLYTIHLHANAGKMMLQRGDYERLANSLDRLGAISQQSLREMRLMLYEMRTPILEKNGLSHAIQQRLDAVESRAGIQAELQTNLSSRLPMAVEEALYRITLEALNNSLKHSHATQVDISLIHINGHIELKVRNNGDPFDPQQAANNGGMGLLNMRERAEKLNGTFSILSNTQDGTVLIVNIPLSITSELM